MAGDPKPQRILRTIVKRDDRGLIEEFDRFETVVPARPTKMDPETSKAWNDWAAKIALTYAEGWSKAGIEAVKPYLIDYGKRIEELECEVALLKGQPKPKPKLKANAADEKRQARTAMGFQVGSCDG
jgi:hypothetical protein